MDESKAVDNTVTQQAKLTACLIVKDEERFLPACLASLSGIADEIVIIDTGSSDATKEIASSKGAILYAYAWEDDFAKARNFAIEKATGTHILMIDADERLGKESKDKIDRFLREYPLSLGQVAIKSPYQQSDGLTYTASSKVTRIFPNNSSIRYQGRIHEQIIATDPSIQTVATGIILEHDGYALSDQAMRDKTKRNLKLLEAELAREPHNAYLHFQVGKTLVADRQQEEALEHYELALVSAKEQATYRPELLMATLYLLKDMKFQDKIWAWVRWGLERYNDYPDLYFFVAKALMAFQVDNLPMIQQCLELCISLGDRSEQYPCVDGTGTFLAQFNLGVFYEVQNQWEEAQNHYQISLDQGFTPAKAALDRLQSKVLLMKKR